MSKKPECECVDPACDCAGQCHEVSVSRIYRVDMVDSSGTAMCQACLEDAMESGVFDTEPNFYS